MKTVIEIKNIDDLVIWNTESPFSFLSFMKGIFSENEVHTDERDTLPPLETEVDAYNYLHEYCDNLYCKYKETPLEIINTALMNYIEDSAGRDSEEAKEIETAFNDVKRTLQSTANDLNMAVDGSWDIDNGESMSCFNDLIEKIVSIGVEPPTSTEEA